MLISQPFPSQAINLMKLTHKNLHEAGFNGCGFNSDQLAVIGIKWPPKKGWLSKLIGTEISESDYEKFKSLKGSKRRVRITSATKSLQSGASYGQKT